MCILFFFFTLSYESSKHFSRIQARKLNIHTCTKIIYTNTTFFTNIKLGLTAEALIKKATSSRPNQNIKYLLLLIYKDVVCISLSFEKQDELSRSISLLLLQIRLTTRLQVLYYFKFSINILHRRFPTNKIG